MPDESIPPIPTNFGPRYIAWWMWCNAISLLASIQAVFAGITLDPTLVDHQTFHVISICNLALIIVIAQVKKSNPPPPSAKS